MNTAYELKINPKQAKVEIVSLSVRNFKGVRQFSHDFTQNPNCVVFGKNGGGKSSVLDSLPFLFLGKNGVNGKLDNVVGPYGKKALIETRIKTPSEVFELGEDLFIRMSVTPSGKTSFTVTDEKTGEVHKTSPREKIQKLLNRYLDPVALVKELETRDGDKNLAATLAALHGLDLNPYVAEDQRLAEELKLENRELTRQRQALKSLVKPQKDWPTEHAEPAAITEQLESLRNLQGRNYEKVLKIAKAQDKARRANEERGKLAEKIPELQRDFEQIQKEAGEGQNTLTVKKAELQNLKKENAARQWKGRGEETMENEIAELEAQIKKVREEQKEKQGFERALRKDKERESEFETWIIKLEERVKARKEMAQNKLKEWDGGQLKLKTREQNFQDLLERVEHLENRLLPLEAWQGERDPEGRLFPAEWLKTRQKQAEKDNDLFRQRQAYQKAEAGIESLQTLMDALKKNRKANQAMKDQAVAQAAENFPYPGMTLDENTIWLDMGDGRGRRTVNDISEGEKLKVCCHIIIALNERDGKKLDVLLIRDGSALDADNRQVIYNAAKEHGYKVVLETIETTEAGALRIEAGQVAGVNPEPETIATEPEMETALNW